MHFEFVIMHNFLYGKHFFGKLINNSFSFVDNFLGIHCRYNDCGNKWKKLQYKPSIYAWQVATTLLLVMINV